MEPIVSGEPPTRRRELPLPSLARAAAWLQVAIGLVAGFGTLVVVPGSPVSFRLLGVLVAVMGVWTVIGVTSRRVVSVEGDRGQLVLFGGVACVAAGSWVGLAPTVDARGLLVAAGIGFLGTSVGYFAVAQVEATYPGRECWFALALTLSVLGLLLVLVPVESVESAQVVVGAVFVGVSLVAAAAVLLGTIDVGDD